MSVAAVKMKEELEWSETDKGNILVRPFNSQPHPHLTNISFLSSHLFIGDTL